MHCSDGLWEGGGASVPSSKKGCDRSPDLSLVQKGCAGPPQDEFSPSQKVLGPLLLQTSPTSSPVCRVDAKGASGTALKTSGA